ncbi:hypothetical protein KSP40_PGU021574 [Platanthera guangdongensis]|uniref:Uncharacterized protein n=1 Tax=Platanthera guangdongensis TaxID=2320717 RepID=A0ABR2MXK6_9ASPA
MPPAPLSCERLSTPDLMYVGPPLLRVLSAHNFALTATLLQETRHELGLLQTRVEAVEDYNA